MESIKLYSTGCPKCIALEQRLKAKKIVVEKISNIDQIKARGISSVPVLDVNGNLMNFSEAMKWVKEN